MTKKIFVISFLLLLSFYGCSIQNEDDLMESAKKNIENEQYKEALKDFKKLITDFPQGKNRGAANFEIAALYESYVDDNLTKKESLEEAIVHYKIVYEEYPDIEQAPKALFKTGYIQANTLHRYDEAIETYNLFLERYPDSELAISVKYEIQNIGLSPEEILKKYADESQVEQN